MDVWEWLVANSKLASSAGDAWDHLTTPNSSGQVDTLKEWANDKIVEITSVDGIESIADLDVITAKVDLDLIEDEEAKDDIIKEKEDVINEVC